MGAGVQHVLLDPTLLQWFETLGPQKDSPMNQHTKQNKSAIRPTIIQR